MKNKKYMAQNVARNRPMKAAFILTLASLGAAVGLYSHGGLGTGLLAVISNEPAAILLSGGFLMGLGGALRRMDF